MTTAPLETPIELFDIALEQMLDGEVVCFAHTSTPAVALIRHTGCPVPGWFICESCAKYARVCLAETHAGLRQASCKPCGAQNIPPADITIRPI